MTQVLRRWNLDMTFCFSLVVLSVRVRMHRCLMMMRGGTLNATMSEGLRPDRLTTFSLGAQHAVKSSGVDSSVRHNRATQIRVSQLRDS